MFIKQNTFKNLPKVLILTLMILSNCFAMNSGSNNNKRPLTGLYRLGIPGVNPNSLEYCFICKDNSPVKDLLSLHCGHRFCKKCLVEFVTSQTRMNIIPPCCPCCRKHFTDKDVDNILEEHVFEAWDFLRNLDVMKKEEDFFSCCTPNCRNGLLYSKGDEKMWKCDECLHQYCLTCKKEAHTGLCEDYEKYLEGDDQRGLSVRELFQAGKIKRCPECRIYTHRVDDEIRDIICERCGTSWCWYTIKLRGFCDCALHSKVSGKKRKRSKRDSAKGKYKKKRKLNEDEDEDEDEDEGED